MPYEWEGLLDEDFAGGAVLAEDVDAAGCGMRDEAAVEIEVLGFTAGCVDQYVLHTGHYVEVEQIASGSFAVGIYCGYKYFVACREEGSLGSRKHQIVCGGFR